MISHKVSLDRVTMLPLGTSDVTYVALEAETIDAAMVQIPHNFVAVGYYLASGAVDEKLQREMISVAAQRVKLVESFR